jgi:hypothetical protein
LKQLQEAVGNTLEQIGIRNNFLNRTPKPQDLKQTMNKWDCIKLKSFCPAKETVTRLKRQCAVWEKIFASYSPDKDLISRIYRDEIIKERGFHLVSKELTRSKCKIAIYK